MLSRARIQKGVILWKLALLQRTSDAASSELSFLALGQTTARHA